jgi:hypothetical protein
MVAISTHETSVSSPHSRDTQPRFGQAIGLDDVRSWVIVSEHNIDEWPNAGLSPVPGKPGVFGYGFIPPGLFAQIKARFLELARQNKSSAVRR